MRSIDWKCSCGREDLDALANVEDIRACPSCGAAMEQIWWARRAQNAQWDDSVSVLVHVDPKTGDVRYPGRHDATVKPGYERVYLRSLQDVNRFERQHNVANERMHFDRNGRGLGDQIVGSH